MSQIATSPQVDVSKLRARAASFALVTTLGLTLAKVAAAYVSGSVGVLSEGIHSGLDLVSAAIAFFTIRAAGKPADSDHPFGHGKIETLSSLVESLLLIAAAAFIVFEGVSHWRNPQPVVAQGWAMLVIAGSLVVSIVVFIHNSRAAVATESSAIQVNALHFLADAVTAAGVLLALIVIHFTGWLWVDPTVAFAIAIYIFLISLKQVKQAVLELTDMALPAEEVTAIRNVLDGYRPRMFEAHDLKTRKSGAERLVEFHLGVCAKMNVKESHEICDEMEEKIMALFNFGAAVTIHVEPCSTHDPGVPMACDRSPGGMCEYRASCRL